MYKIITYISNKTSKIGIKCLLIILSYNGPKIDLDSYSIHLLDRLVIIGTRPLLQNNNLYKKMYKNSPNKEGL